MEPPANTLRPCVRPVNAGILLEGLDSSRLLARSAKLSFSLAGGLSGPTTLVVDDCGSGVDNATLVASVEGLNIPLRTLGTGFYSGTWVPVTAAAIW